MSNKLNVAQVSVTNAATQIIAANSGRLGLVVTNTDSTATCYLGPTSGVTSTTGHALPAGQSVSLEVVAGQAGNWTGALFGITASATITVTYLEESSS